MPAVARLDVAAIEAAAAAAAAAVVPAVTAPAPRVRRAPGAVVGDLLESKESCDAVWRAATLISKTPADATDVQRLQLWVMKGPAMVGVSMTLLVVKAVALHV
jgi:hypothetical protein